MLVKNLSISVTYQVEFNDIDIPEEIVEQLKDEKDTSLMSYDEQIKYAKSIDWMIDNCRENDSLETNFEVTYIDE